MITHTTFMPYKREEGLPSLEIGHETLRQLGLRLQYCPQTSSQEGGGFGEWERADPLTYYHQCPAGRGPPYWPALIITLCNAMAAGHYTPDIGHHPLFIECKALLTGRYSEKLASRVQMGLSSKLVSYCKSVLSSNPNASQTLSPSCHKENLHVMHITHSQSTYVYK